MKSFSLKFYIIVLFSSFFFSTAFAKLNSIEQYSQQVKIEQAINSKISQILLKLIDPKLFQVSSQAELAPWGSEIKSVQITLKLSPTLTAKYRHQLTQWLLQWTENTYGLRGSAKVELILASPISTSELITFNYDLIFFLIALLVSVYFLALAIRRSRPAKQLCFSFMNEKRVMSPGCDRALIDSEIQPTTKSISTVYNNALQLEFIEAVLPIAFEPVVEVEAFVDDQLDDQLDDQEVFQVDDVEDTAEIVSPFVFIEELNIELFIDMFLFLDLSCQIAFMMKGPRLSVQRLTNALDKKILNLILLESSKVVEASDEELFKQMKNWKEKPILETNSDLSNVNLEKQTRLKEIWLELSPLDRTLMLEQLSATQPELVNFFLEGRTEIYSIKSWSVEKLRKFCIQTKTRELGALIKLVPFLSPIVLTVLTTSLRNEILQQVNDATADQKVQHNFEALISSFERFCIRNTKLESVKLSGLKTNFLE